MVKFYVYYHFEVNVLRWCPFIHLFNTPFQNSPYDDDIIFLLSLMTTISLMLAIFLTLSVPHMIDSYWLVILMLEIPKKLGSIFLRSTTLQTLQKNKLVLKV